MTPTSDRTLGPCAVDPEAIGAGGFLFRLMLFIGLAALLQAIVSPWNAYEDKPLHPTLSRQVHIISARHFDSLVARQPEVLFLGDSTAFETEPTARDQRTTYDLLAEALPEHNVAGLCLWAFNMEMMLHSFDYLLRRGCTPSVAIAVINVRSFSPTWYYKSTYQFEEMRRFFAYDSTAYRVLGAPLAIFAPATPTRFTREEYDAQLEWTLERLSQEYDIATWSRYGKLETAQWLKYAFLLEPPHPILESTREMTLMASEHGVQLLFYVAPLDGPYISTVYGQEVLELTQKNVQSITQFLETSGAHVLDLSDALEPAYFDSFWGMASHLNLEGRRALAERLAAEVEGLIPKGIARSGPTGLPHRNSASEPLPDNRS